VTATGVRVTGELLAAVRVRHWTKNALVLAPLLPAADRLSTHALLGAVVAFVMFCLISSGIYLVNDVVDVQTDRAHPVKRFRPIAAGAVSTRTALGSAAVLLASGLALAAAHSVELLLVAATYVTLLLAYCLWLKREPVVELGIVASGFLLRALAGAVAASIPLSPWFLLAAGFGSLFVAAGKRYAEAQRAHRGAETVRAVVRAYSRSYLRFVWTTAAALVIATYALWAFQVHDQRDSAWSMASTVPFVLAVLRYAINVDAGHAEEPEDIILHDRMLLALGALWAVLLVLAVFA
jgi:decaprenyl-phosphate phosphoribosyltransferase